MLDRRNPYSAIPQLEKKVDELSEKQNTNSVTTKELRNVLSEIKKLFTSKQDKLTAGERISITDNVISAEESGIPQTLKLVNIGTVNFSGTSAYAQSAPKTISLPAVDGFKPFAFSHTNALTSSAYKLICTQFYFDETSATFRMYNASSSQAVGDVEIYMIYAKTESIS